MYQLLSNIASTLHSLAAQCCCCGRSGDAVEQIKWPKSIDATVHLGKFWSNIFPVVSTHIDNVLFKLQCLIVMPNYAVCDYAWFILESHQPFHLCLLTLLL